MLPLEFVLRHRAAPGPPPIFIIGPPRSGSSLLYELLMTRFRFAYISNAAHRFPRTPLAATQLFRSIIENWSGSFASRTGHIEGWGAPNEGGWVWRRWLRDGDWSNGDELSDRQVSGLRTLTTGLSEILTAPFLNKNVMHSNRLLAISRIWDDALFLVVERDHLDNARSIVRAERTRIGPKLDEDGWWSVRPRGARNFFGAADTVRAAAQVVGVHEDIKTDMKAVGEQRFHWIGYEQLCSNCNLEISKISEFLKHRGIILEDRRTIPDRFPRPAPYRLSDGDEREMFRTISNIKD